MTDLGEVYHVLGMHIQRDRLQGWLRINQSTSISNKLSHFNLLHCKPVSTPYVTGFPLSKTQSPDPPAAQAFRTTVPYQSTTGNLMWAMVCSRPDIAYSMSTVTQFLTNPGPAHWTAVKHISGYLQGTKDHCLQCTRSTRPFHQGYSDAAYVDKGDTRRSSAGFCFLLVGGAITWASRKQKSITLSSTESEYMSLSKASTEAVKITVRYRIYSQG